MSEAAINIAFTTGTALLVLGGIWLFVEMMWFTSPASWNRRASVAMVMVAAGWLVDCATSIAITIA